MYHLRATRAKVEGLSISLKEQPDPFTSLQSRFKYLPARCWPPCMVVGSAPLIYLIGNGLAQICRVSSREPFTSFSHIHRMVRAGRGGRTLHNFYTYPYTVHYGAAISSMFPISDLPLNLIRLPLFPFVYGLIHNKRKYQTG